MNILVNVGVGQIWYDLLLETAVFGMKGLHLS